MWVYAIQCRHVRDEGADDEGGLYAQGDGLCGAERCGGEARPPAVGVRDGGATQQGHGGKGKERAWVGMGISDREWSGEREGRSASPQRQKVETAVCVGAARERNREYRE